MGSRWRQNRIGSQISEEEKLSHEYQSLHNEVKERELTDEDSPELLSNVSKAVHELCKIGTEKDMMEHKDWDQDEFMQKVQDVTERIKDQ